LTVLEKSDPNYESKLKERLKAEILAEQNGTRQPQTPTLADARGGAGARPAEWSGPMGLNDILK
jgi:hypothetical protein